MTDVELTDAQAEELLGAYALDACEPHEVGAVEAVLARRPDLAAEALRLRRAAAWIGATEALDPPPSLRADLLARAQRRRSVADDPVVELYSSFAEGFGAAVEALPEDRYDVGTWNGLCARDLVVHMAAQESLFAQCIGHPTFPDVTEDDIDARTHELLPRFEDAPLADAVDLWRDSVAATESWALAGADRSARWRGAEMSRDDVLVVRAFETWVHTDDLRRVMALEPVEPAARHLALMSDLARRILPLSLALSDRARPGRTARLVLTGEGGGDWLVPMGGDRPGAVPDVTLTADVVDWCRLVGDRIAPAELVCSWDGDAALADDLVHAAPALATL